MKVQSKPRLGISDDLEVSWQGVDLTSETRGQLSSELLADPIVASPSQLKAYLGPHQQPGFKLAFGPWAIAVLTQKPLTLIAYYFPSCVLLLKGRFKVIRHGHKGAFKLDHQAEIEIVVKPVKTALKKSSPVVYQHHYDPLDQKIEAVHELLNDAKRLID